MTAIVLAYNGRPYLGACLRSVLSQDCPQLDVVVVDNASADGSAELVAREFPDVRLVQNERNLGFAGGNNVGIRLTAGELVVLINQDVELASDCISALVREFEAEPRVGVAGCKIYDPDWRTLQHVGGELQPNGLSSHVGRGQQDVGQYESVTDREYVTGAVLAIRREVLARCGLLDESYFPAYYEETDLCVTARQAGYRVVCVPQARLIHHEATSTGKASQAYLRAYHRNRVRFVLKTFSLRRIIRDAIPFEVGWVLGSMPPRQLSAVVSAYASAVRELPDIVQRRRSRLSGRGA